MADKPSRALILYGYGLAASINSSHAHFHTLASLGCCGFLALDNLPSSDDGDDRLVRELAQLLDACEAYQIAAGEKISESENQNTVPTVSERFMGMRAAIVTNNSTVKCFGEALGFVGIELDKLGRAEKSVNYTADELLKLLGFEDGKTLETGQFDLVFVHIGSNEKSMRRELLSAEDIEYMNNLVGQILQTSQFFSTIRSRLHLSLLMSYDAASEKDPNLLLPALQHEENNNLSFLFPRQSYMLKEGKLRTNIRKHCPVLVVQWQEAVTRKDNTEMFSFDDFRKNTAIHTIPADRFLYEIAFKLWKAPKYGA